MRLRRVHKGVRTLLFVPLSTEKAAANHFAAAFFLAKEANLNYFDFANAPSGRAMSFRAE